MVYRSRVCESCGSSYPPKVRNQRYCSNDCRRRAYGKYENTEYKPEPGHKAKYKTEYKQYKIKKTKLKICEECGREFLTNNKRKVYCSKECQLVHKEKTHKRKEKRKCLVCGETFETAHNLKRYCSEVCYLKAKKQRDTKPESKGEKGCNIQT